MNWLITISGIFALLTTMGHFMVGSRDFLKPMLASDFEAVPKKVMHCVFHYVSTFLVVSTIFLLGVGTATIQSPGSLLLVQFIALNFAIFAVWQLALAATSGIPKGIFKLFQWVFFVLISGFAFVGAPPTW